MKIITPEESKLIDSLLQSKFGIDSLILMENAARDTLELLSKITNNEWNKYNFLIFSGTGNNGGDGIALARHISSLSPNLKVFIVGDTNKTTKETQKNLEILSGLNALIQALPVSVQATITKQVPQTIINNYNYICDILAITDLIEDMANRDILHHIYYTETLKEQDIGVYFYICFADFNSVTTRWNSGWLKFEESLSVRGIAMMWNWCDSSPFVSFTGTFVKSLENIINGLSYLTSAVSNTKGRVQVLLDDATVLSKIPPEEKFDIIVTDPPYRDDVPYAELSDFYYVWLKRALSDSGGRKLIPRFFEEAFFRKVGAKYREIETQWQEFAKREISKNPGRFLDVENRDEHAEKHFRELFTQAMISIRNRLREDGIAAIYFAHTSFEAWALLLEAVRKAGFMVTGAFPAATESKDRVTGRGKMTMDTSIVVVCRPNPEQRDIQITSLIPLIRKSAEAYARTLATKEIPGRDILIGTMIGAIREVTKYSRILTPAGELSMEDVLRDYVYPLIGSVMAEVYAGVSGAKEPVRDSVALFYLLAKVAFGGKGGTNPFTTDDVITLCRASKLDVDTARTILIESGSENETEEEEVVEEGGSKVASSRTVRLAELKSKEPVKIRSFLLARNISPDSAVKKLRHAVDAYHLLLFYASAYDNQRIRFEYEELRGVYPDVVSEAVKLMKVVARMKNGVEMELARRFLQAVEGLG